jgi:hypothetical protein
MFQFFAKKVVPAVAVVGTTLAATAVTELLTNRVEGRFAQQGLATQRVWKTNGTTPYLSVEVVPSPKP